MKTIYLIIVALFLSWTASGQEYVRYNANSEKGKEHLAAMRVAFEKMRGMDCTEGLSWYYQGAMHNIPGTINGTNKNCAEYQNSDDKLWAWGDCPHISTENARLHFLLWHRMYIWYLEKAVRELSGVDDFAIPYWNYGGESTADNTMPVQMQDPSSSLFESARYSILNSGQPIQPFYVQKIQKEINELMRNPTFAGEGGFTEKLEVAPHGFMHSYIGAAYSNPRETFYNQIYQEENYPGLMANVPSAGFDPIFWLHHSQVDRIWESWDVLPIGERPTLEEIEALPWQYQFIGPKGERVTYTMAELYKVVFNLDYKYDNLITPDEPAIAMVEMPESLKKVKPLLGLPEPTVLWTKDIGQVLGSTEFSTTIEKKSAKKTRKSLKKMIERPLILNVEVSVYDEPTDFYTVSIRYEGRELEHVGMITFFGVGHEHGTGANHEIAEAGVDLTYSFHVSDDLLSSKEPYEIVIEKHGEGDTKVTLEQISITRAD